MQIVEFDEKGDQVPKENLSFDSKIKAEIVKIVTNEFKKDYLDNEDCQIITEEISDNEIGLFAFSSKGLMFCKITYSCNGPKPKIIKVENL